MSRRSYRKIQSKEGKILRFMRKKSGLSLRKVAARVGITDSMICHIDIGRQDLPAGRLDALLGVYGFTRGDFDTYMTGKRIPVDLRDECVELLRGLKEEKLKSVYALLSTL